MIVNSVLKLVTGIMQANYQSESIGNVLTGTTTVTVPIKPTTASNVAPGTVGASFMTQGLVRFKVYGLGGTAPTFQVDLYNNAITDSLIYSGPVGGLQDITLPFQVDTNMTNLVAVCTGGGTSPTGEIDIEVVGSN